jgi:hypothetical protein
MTQIIKRLLNKLRKLINKLKNKIKKESMRSWNKLIIVKRKNNLKVSKNQNKKIKNKLSNHQILKKSI